MIINFIICFLNVYTLLKDMKCKNYDSIKALSINLRILNNLNTFNPYYKNNSYKILIYISISFTKNFSQ